MVLLAKTGKNVTFFTENKERSYLFTVYYGTSSIRVVAGEPARMDLRISTSSV